MNNETLTFSEELNRPTINVPRAALCFSRALAYPQMDIEAYLAKIDRLAQAARPQVQDAIDFHEKVDTLSDFLFYQKNFQGNRAQYHDPRNSYLNCVLDRKTGNPITLSVIYIAVARRLGMHAYGINLPGHFIVGVYEEGSQVMLDPFNTGLRLSNADCARLVHASTGYDGAFQQKWLNAVSPGDMLARMLTNLCNAYIQRENWHNAIPVIQHLLMVQPATDFHLRDLGYLYLYNGSLRLSAQFLEEYLRRAPQANDFDNVLTSLQIVAGRLALWN